MTEEFDGYAVLLGDVLVGSLVLENDAPTFRFAESYCDRPNRPVLSLSFEDDPPTPARAVVEEDGRLPRFFRNLLPEGHLLEIYARHIERLRHREFELLGLIGEDLPGAVRVVRDPLTAIEPARPAPSPYRFAFGLAGVQFKLQAVRSESRLTIPAIGERAQFIAKFGRSEYPELVHNEWTMLTWAKACALDVPAFQLRDSSEFDDPSGVIAEAFEGPVLLVERFDRLGATRQHQEDFAQILSLHPEQKYDADVDDDVNYSTIGNVVSAYCGRRALAEYVRRLLFMVLSGNGDAHTKNWALTHVCSARGISSPRSGPEQTLPQRLAPLYDVVSTIAYPSLFQRQLALRLSGELRLDAITREHIIELCQRIGADRDEVSRLITDFCALARARWTDLRDRSEVPARVRRAVDENLELCASPKRAL
jgi:serine/threonine-protein kinase HipA